MCRAQAVSKVSHHKSCPGLVPKAFSCLVTGVEWQVQGSAFHFSCEAFLILVHYLFPGHL